MNLLIFGTINFKKKKKKVCSKGMNYEQPYSGSFVHYANHQLN